MSSSRACDEAYIGTGRPCETPIERAGQPLGVEGEVGDHVAARPAGQQRGGGVLLVGHVVHRADQPVGGVLDGGEWHHVPILAHHAVRTVSSTVGGA